MRMIRNSFLSHGRMKAIDLSYGDLAIILDAEEHTGEIVMRTFYGIVSLNNPKITWDEVATRQHWVDKLPKGESVTLIQE